MIELYKKAFLTFIVLVIITIITSYIALDRAYLESHLLPVNENNLNWQAEKISDAQEGGNSSTVVNDARYSLDVNFNLQPTAQYPYTSIALVFYDLEGKPQLVDLSRYHSLTFTVKCSPHNVLLFAAYTVDDNRTVTDDLLTYRTPTTFFSCDEDWKEIQIDLTRLKTPVWWFDKFEIELSQQDYQLNKVPRLSIGTTHQSPMSVDANVQIHELMLQGYDWRYLFTLITTLVILWVGFIFWFYKQHTKTLMIDLKNKLYKDRPLVAYQKLSLEPQRDKDKAAILRFLATEYANPDINVEWCISKLGVSRTKINDILKDELGYTFIAYLNKLRLTEASRLLSESADANVAEIAYSVGYNNVTYFNKLFKNEFGCTPKAFTTLQKIQK